MSCLSTNFYFPLVLYRLPCRLQRANEGCPVFDSNALSE